MEFNWHRDAIAHSPISIIVPAYPSLPESAGTLLQLTELVSKLKQDYEILLILDKGHNAPPDIPEKTRIISDQSLTGYGQSLCIGLQQVQHPLAFTIPGDGSCPPEVLPRMLAVIDQVDMVTGNRQSISRIRKLRRKWAANLTFGLIFNDPSCPVKLFRRDILARIPIQSKSRFADVELLAKANFLSCLITEIDIPGTARTSREPASPFSDALRVFRNPTFAH